MADPQENKQIVESCWQTLCLRDWEKLAGYFAPHALYETPAWWIERLAKHSAADFGGEA